MSTTPVKFGNKPATGQGLQLQARWDALGARERRLLLAGALIVLAALVWWVALKPALATLRGAEQQHQQLDAQLLQMQQLKLQAQTLQAQPKQTSDDTQRALEALQKQAPAGTVQLAMQGERATVTFKNASANAVADWLTQARQNARAVPTEVRLVRSSVAVAAPLAGNAGNLPTGGGSGSRGMANPGGGVTSPAGLGDVGANLARNLGSAVSMGWQINPDGGVIPRTEAMRGGGAGGGVAGVPANAPGRPAPTLPPATPAPLKPMPLMDGAAPLPGADSPATGPNPVSWDGTVVLALPAR